MQLPTCLLLAVISSLTRLSNAASNDEWASQSIYQVITDRFARSSDLDAPCTIGLYCGGTWAGIVDRLDYIQNMGFTAIQISPINENLAGTTIFGEAFHGYWVQNLYALNSNFGNETDLKNLADELHSRKMLLLVDIVAEDMAYNIGDANMTNTTVIDYSVFTPFNNADYFNPWCIDNNWEDAADYQNCWLSSEGVVTPALLTGSDTVITTLSSWIKELVSNYSIDGIRFDGAKQSHLNLFEPFVSSAGVYTMAEVDDGNPSLVCSYQNYTGGMENYPLFATIITAFTTGPMAPLVSMISAMRTECSSTQYLSTFIENQDNERFASYTSDLALASNALSFMMLADGIPKLYYGQEQHFTGVAAPDNRQPLWPSNYNLSAPLYVLTKALNSVRNHVISIDSNYVTNLSTTLYSDNSTYAARKGPNGVQIVSVLSNHGANGDAYTLSVPGAADSGTVMTEIIGCTNVTASDDGAIVVDMDKGAPKVFFPAAKLGGSGLCEYTTAVTTSAPSPSATATGPQSTPSKKSGAGRQWEVSLALVFGFLGVFLTAL